MTAPETIPVPARLLQGPAERHFALRVEGDALAQHGILDGDVLLALLHHEPGDGDALLGRHWVASGHLACEEASRHVPAPVAIDRADSWCLACGAPLIFWRWQLSFAAVGDDEPEGVVLALIRTFTGGPLPLETVEVAVGGVIS